MNDNSRRIHVCLGKMSFYEWETFLRKNICSRNLNADSRLFPFFHDYIWCLWTIFCIIVEKKNLFYANGIIVNIGNSVWKSDSWMEFWQKERQQTTCKWPYVLFRPFHDPELIEIDRGKKTTLLLYFLSDTFCQLRNNFSTQVFERVKTRFLC
jgi:hypothetical protein